MPKFFLLFNHTLTPGQQECARRELGVDAIIEAPPKLRHSWANIPPDIANLYPWLQPVRDWLTVHALPDDYVLIQGDFGACYLLVRFALEYGLVPVYATTERHAQEEHLEDGRVLIEHTFSHVRFRRYGV